MEVTIDNLEDMCALMCDNRLPKGEVKMRIERIAVETKIYNLPSKIHEGWMVVRAIETDLWFYAIYTNEERALEVAEELGNGIVMKVKGE